MQGITVIVPGPDHKCARCIPFQSVVHQSFTTERCMARYSDSSHKTNHTFARSWYDIERRVHPEAAATGEGDTNQKDGDGGGSSVSVCTCR
jgi:hypothetical protein